MLLTHVLNDVNQPYDSSTSFFSSPDDFRNMRLESKDNFPLPMTTHTNLLIILHLRNAVEDVQGLSTLVPALFTSFRLLQWANF